MLFCAVEMKNGLNEQNRYIWLLNAEIEVVTLSNINRTVQGVMVKVPQNDNVRESGLLSYMCNMKSAGIDFASTRGKFNYNFICIREKGLTKMLIVTNKLAGYVSHIV